MILFLKLLLAHFIGDFLLQPLSWVLDKEERKLKSPKFYFHVLLHGLLYLILIWDLSLWYIPLILMGFHGIIDALKLYFQKDTSRWLSFALDQIAHLTTIVWVCIYFQENFFDIGTLWNEKNLILLIAILILTNPSSIAIKIFISKWTPHTTNVEDESLLNAGKYIGILERMLIFIFIINGHWEAIGFLITAKSVFRFGDLKESGDRKLTEYIMIGTLLSFGIAIVIGLCYSSYMSS